MSKWTCREEFLEEGRAVQETARQERKQSGWVGQQKGRSSERQPPLRSWRAILSPLGLALTRSDFCFQRLLLAAELRTDCRGKYGRKEPSQKTLRETTECDLDQCDSGGDAESGQFLDVFKGQAIRTSWQIKCTERKRIWGSFQGFGSETPEDRAASNRDVLIQKGTGSPLPFLLLVAQATRRRNV